MRKLTILAIPLNRKQQQALQTLSTEVDDDNPSVMIAYCNVQYLENYCRQAAKNLAPIAPLIYALPSLVNAMEQRPASDREVIKTGIKQILFHATITDVERDRIYKAFCQICRM